MANTKWIVTREPITARQAYTIASQWGSYIHSGDPGSVFYTFPPDSADVQSEEHRESLITYTNDCLLKVTRTMDNGHGNRRDLLMLRHYFETAKAKDELVWWSGNYGIELEMTREQAESVSHTGRCDEDVSALSKKTDLAEQLAKIDPSKLRQELREYGAWSAHELSDHEQNLQRILWLAGGAIADGQCDPEKTELNPPVTR